MREILKRIWLFDKINKVHLPNDSLTSHYMVEEGAVDLFEVERSLFEPAIFYFSVAFI